MCKIIMIGCDLHDVWTVLRVAQGTGDSERKAFRTSERPEMIAWIKQLAAERGADRIVFAYEASGQGFGLHDDLRVAGIECHVLAPTHLPHTLHSRKNKTDDKDAEMLLDEVRGHVLAGRPLAKVWVPDPQTREDREVVRQRLQVAQERTRAKNRIRNLFKRWQCKFPEGFTASGDWSRKSLQWLDELAAATAGGLPAGARITLASLLSVYRALSEEIKRLDQAILDLSRTPRYSRSFRKLQLLPGVGVLTAMTFLTEMGDLERFANRRQLSAYLGLAPACFESGERHDRKGHITRQGPARIRGVLNQAAWASLRCSAEWRKKFDQIKRGSPRRGKIAIVALMRQLGVMMWQVARSREWDELLAEEPASARAQQKRAAPLTSPSPRPRGGEAEAAARRKGRTTPVSQGGSSGNS